MFFQLLLVFVIKFIFLSQVFLNLYAFSTLERLTDFFHFITFACCHRLSFYLISLFGVEIVTSWYYFNVELHVNSFLNLTGIISKKLSNSRSILKEGRKSIINWLYLSFKMLPKKFRLMGLAKIASKILLCKVILVIEEMIELNRFILTFEGEVFIWKLTTSKFIITLAKYIENKNYEINH